MDVLKRWVVAIAAAMLVSAILTIVGFHSPVPPFAGGITAVFVASYLRTRAKAERNRG